MANLIFGCGYLGRRVADRWREAGHLVHAVTRSTKRAAEFAAKGLTPIVADLANPGSLPTLPDVDTVLFAVGFDRTSKQTIQQVYVDGLHHALGQLPAFKKFIYISSTGVFGQNDGAWVDESSPCEPTREGGRACLAAEKLLTEELLARGQSDRGVILRLAGLYGPGRIPMADRLQRGESLPVPTEGYINLIHVDDAASIVLAAESAPSPLYLVSDGQPVPRREYYSYIAQLLDAPEPQFARPADRSHVSARAGGDKRISNKRMCDELGVQLRYSSYRDGLAAILNTEK